MSDLKKSSQLRDLIETITTFAVVSDNFRFLPVLNLSFPRESWPGLHLRGREVDRPEMRRRGTKCDAMRHVATPAASWPIEPTDWVTIYVTHSPREFRSIRHSF
jgi:hypothetical protein